MTPDCRCPKSISGSWNLGALEEIEIWLRKQLRNYSTNEQIHIGSIARESRDIATIEKRGNSDGVRYLLGKLREEGLVDCVDEQHFVVKGGDE